MTLTYCPILVKEMRALARGWRFWLARALVVGAMLLTIWLAFAAHRTDGMTYGSAALGAELFGWFVGTVMLVIVVLVPLLLADLLAGELEREALPLLLLTRLTPFRVVAEKLAARLLALALLLATTAPLLLGLLSFGGVTRGDVAAVLPFALALALQVVALGMVALLCTASAAGALVLHVGLMLGLALWPQTTGWVRHPLADLAAWAMAGGQQRSLVGLLGQNRQSYLPETLLLAFLWLTVAMAAAFAAEFVVRARGRRPASRSWAAAAQAALNRVTARWGIWGRQLLRPAPLTGNPVVWFECQRRLLTNASFMVRVFCVLLVASLPLWLVPVAILDHGSEGQARALVGGLHAGLAALVVAATLLLAVLAFGRERERQSLELLFTTPLRSGELLAGKLAGLAKTLAFLPLFALGLLTMPLLCSQFGGFKHCDQLIRMDAAPGRLWLGTLALLPLLLVAGLRAGAARGRFGPALVAALLGVAGRLCLLLVVALTLAIFLQPISVAAAALLMVPQLVLAPLLAPLLGALVLVGAGQLLAVAPDLLTPWIFALPLLPLVLLAWRRAGADRGRVGAELLATVHSAVGLLLLLPAVSVVLVVVLCPDFWAPVGRVGTVLAWYVQGLGTWPWRGWPAGYAVLPALGGALVLVYPALVVGDVWRFWRWFKRDFRRD